MRKILLVFGIVLGLAQPAWSAVAFVSTCGTNQMCADSSDIASTTSLAATRTIDPGTGANKVMVVVFGVSSGTCTAITAPSSITDDKTNTWTSFAALDDQSIGACTGTNYQIRLAAWYSINPASGLTTITIHYSAQPATGTRGAFAATAFTGADQTTPLKNAVSLAQAAGPATISKTVTSAVSDMITDIVCNGTSAPTVANGQTDRGNTASGLTSCASVATGTAAGAATFADTWNVANDSSAILTFDVAAAGGAAATQPMLPLLGVGP